MEGVFAGFGFIVLVYWPVIQFQIPSKKEGSLEGKEVSSPSSTLTMVLGVEALS